MVDSRSHSAATSVESVKDAPETNKEKQFDCAEKLKERLKPCVRLLLMVCVLLHLGMFVAGAVRYNSCPANKNITFYLVAAGVVGAASKIITLIKDSVSDVFKFIKKLEAALYATELLLFILGSQWVFSVFELNCEQGFIDFCDKTTYHLAFWILIVYYALLTIIILLFIFFITTTWILSVIKTNKS